jgi:hypothetical protein
MSPQGIAIETLKGTQFCDDPEFRKLAASNPDFAIIFLCDLK